jgi:serine/threonine protein kinase
MHRGAASWDPDPSSMPTTSADATHPAPRSRRPSAPLEPGARYEITGVIGRGGMGEVLAAYDTQIGREVAIKRIHPERTSPAALARFLREARIQARLEHPAIPSVYELGYDDEGRPFFAMQKLAGVTLAEIVRDPAMRARFSLQRMLRAFVDICLAIELAHSRGVVHRDLKPSNMVLGGFGEVYVLDWGVAHIIDDGEPRTPTVSGIEAGVALGTPGYMAPEQLAGARDLDARADVYSLGCVLFEILRGERLHPQRASARDVLADAASRSDVPPELDELWRRATNPARELRIGSARELGETVQRYLDGDRDLARRHQLAREHLASARAALAEPVDDELRRQTAMRESGRALALDPTLVGAAELVSRLMIEPPADTPRDVVAELAALDERDERTQSWIASAIYFAYCGLVPLLFAFGVRDLRYLGSFAALAVIASVLHLMVARDQRTPYRIAAAVAGACLIAMFARMFTPFLVAPGVCAVTVMAIVLHPVATRRSVAWCGVLDVAAVIGVWIAEATGFVSPTITIVRGTVHLQPPIAGIEALPIIPALCFYAIALTAVAGTLAFVAVQRGREARRQLHIQAWQLRQLISVTSHHT